ncbi:unnamed protein product [Urochloa decumbens]|uniref:Ubiquitin-like protease family profile domain-containing protein n=1 Tax=Urochloa decumbens TaxID=240449 RepID=A0ABC9B599_9POAL
MIRQRRRQRLRLPSPPPAHSEHLESEHDDAADDDFAPNVEIRVVAQESNRKRRREQSRGDSSTLGTVAAPVPGPSPAPVPMPADHKKKTNQAIRCSPSKFRDIVNALDDTLKDAVREKNFGGLLDFKPHALDRQLLSFLMRRLHPDTMTLELDGDQRISITEHTVWTLAGDIGLRAFFMCAFQSLLFSNSSCYIRLDDVKYTEDMDNISQMNWCKVVVDNLSKAARLYKVDFESKGMAAPISGCRIFLVMLYIDFLHHSYNLNPFALPWCAHLETNMIDRISSEDRRGDVAAGVVLNFGHLRLKNINDTCYRLPHPALAIGAPPTAPAAPFVAYPGPSTSVVPSTSAGTSQHVPAACHDPGGQAGFNLQPPGPVRYTSLSAAFSQGIIDIVGRSQKSQAMKILEDFDASALEAQSLKAQAVSFMNRAARRGRQRNTAPASGMPPATDQPAKVEQPAEATHDAEQAVQEPAEVPAKDPEQHVPADGEETNEHGEPFDAQPLETRGEDTGSEGGDEFMEGLFTSPGSEDSHGGDDGRSPDHQGNDDFMDPVISIVNQQQSVDPNPEAAFPDGVGDGMQRRPEATDPVEDTGGHSVDVDMTDVVHTEPPVHEPSRDVSGDEPGKECGSDGTNVAKTSELEKDDTTNKDVVDETSGGASNNDVVDETSGGAGNIGPGNEIHVDKTSELGGDAPEKDVAAAGDMGPSGEIRAAQEHGIVDTTEHGTVVIHKEHGTADTTRLEVRTKHVTEQALDKSQSVTYSRRTTRATRAAEASKRKSAEANKAKQHDAAADKEEKRLQAERRKEEKRLEVERKKEEKRLAAEKKKAEKKEQQRLQAERNKAFEEEAGLVMSKEDREKRDAHERRMQLLREHAEHEVEQLKSTINVLAGPRAPAPDQVFPKDSEEDIYSQSPPVRLSQEECFLVQIVTTISNGSSINKTTLIDFSVFLSYDGKDLLTTFADDKADESNLLDYIVHCLQYDDIVHKQDSIGYRVFLTTGLWIAVQDVVQEYMDDGKTETRPFKIMREHLEVQIEHYDLTKPKLIFMPACDGEHYFLYYINLIHNRIDILDSIDYWWTRGDPRRHHQPIWDKLPLINQAFKKLTNGKFPTFYNWSRPFINVVKQAGPSDCMFFLWKYMEFWDGDHLNIEINPFKGTIYRIEMMHYAVFHALNQADLPEELDIYRLGGRKIEFDESQ